MNEKQTFPTVAGVFADYKKYLLSSQIFKELQKDVQSQWIELLNRMEASIVAQDAANLWEAVVDHMLDTDWDFDTGPQVWQDLYNAVDELRTDAGIDSTNQQRADQLV